MLCGTLITDRIYVATNGTKQQKERQFSPSCLVNAFSELHGDRALELAERIKERSADELGRFIQNLQNLGLVCLKEYAKLRKCT